MTLKTRCLALLLTIIAAGAVCAEGCGAVAGPKPLLNAVPLQVVGSSIAPNDALILAYSSSQLYFVDPVSARPISATPIEDIGSAIFDKDGKVAVVATTKGRIAMYDVRGRRTSAETDLAKDLDKEWIGSLEVDLLEVDDGRFIYHDQSTVLLVSYGKALSYRRVARTKGRIDGAVVDAKADVILLLESEDRTARQRISVVDLKTGRIIDSGYRVQGVRTFASAEKGTPSERRWTVDFGAAEDRCASVHRDGTLLGFLGPALFMRAPCGRMSRDGTRYVLQTTSSTAEVHDARGVLQKLDDAYVGAISSDGAFLSGEVGGRQTILTNPGPQARYAPVGIGAHMQEIAFSMGGRELLVTGVDGLAAKLRLDDGTVDYVHLPSRDGPYVQFSADGRSLLQSREGRGTSVTEVSTSKTSAPFPASVGYSPCGRSVASTGADGFLFIAAANGNSEATRYASHLERWGTANRQMERFAESDSPNSCFGVSADGRKAATFMPSGYRGSIEIWTPGTSNVPLVRKIPFDNRHVLSVRMSPDGGFVHLEGDDEDGVLDVKRGEWILRQGSSAGAFSEDNRLFAAYHGGAVHIVELATQTKRAEINVGYDPTDLALSSERHLLAAVNQDGFADVWDTVSGKKLVSFFVGQDGDWLTMTPAGYFSAARRDTQLATVVDGDVSLPIGDFAEQLNRPTLVAANLTGDAEAKHERAASDLDLSKIMSSGAPPSITLARDGSSPPVAGEVSVSAVIEDRGGGIGDLVWRVDDYAFPAPMSNGARDGVNVRITNSFKLDPGKVSTITLEAANKAGLRRSKPSSFTVTPFGDAIGTSRLFVLSIGVGDYAMEKYKLTYPAHDAVAVADALKRSGVESRLFNGSPDPIVLTEEVDYRTIDAAFARIGRDMTRADVFILFVAGHGQSVNGRYYFVPQDFDIEKGDTWDRSWIGQDTWRGWLEKLPAAKQLVILDTCEGDAGAAVVRGPSDGEREYVSAIERLRLATGRAFIAAAAHEEREAPGLEHGILSYAIIDAFRSPPGSTNVFVTAETLASHAGREVPILRKKYFNENASAVIKLLHNDFTIGVQLKDVGLKRDAGQRPERGTKYFALAPVETHVRPDAQSTTAGRLTMYEGVEAEFQGTGGWARVFKNGEDRGFVPGSALQALH